MNIANIARANRIPRGPEAAFSLIEMLIVIALMALAGTFVATNVISKFRASQIDAAKIQIRQLGTILDDYRRVCNSYPQTTQGLQALVEKPVGGKECKNWAPEFIKDGKVPKDPWGEDYLYESDGSSYTLGSKGPDTEVGGEGEDKDISNKDL